MHPPIAGPFFSSSDTGITAQCCPGRQSASVVQIGEAHVEGLQLEP